jgi:hypothetical protein
MVGLLLDDDCMDCDDEDARGDGAAPEADAEAEADDKWTAMVAADTADQRRKRSARRESLFILTKEEKLDARSSRTSTKWLKDGSSSVSRWSPFFSY